MHVNRIQDAPSQGGLRRSIRRDDPDAARRDLGVENVVSDTKLDFARAAPVLLVALTVAL